MTALTSASQSPNATPSKTASATAPARPSTATPQQRQKHTRDPLGGRPPPQHPHDRRPAARRRPATSSNFASFAHNLPVTPAKSPPRKRDSPFSDYFTDEARSIDTTAGPPTPTQRLLVRMAKLQSQLMRTENSADSETLQSIERKLNEIDRQLQGGPSVPTSPHRPRRRPGLPLADSGLFMEDEDDDEEEGEDEDARSQADSSARENDTLDSNASGSPFADLHITPKPSTELRTPSPTKALSTTEKPHTTADDNNDGASITSTTSLTPSDPLHAQLRTLLAAVTTAQAELRQRCAEVRALHDRHDGDCEAQQAALEALQAENEALRTDLGFEYSELLFLKLQMKALEVEVHNEEEDEADGGGERDRKRRNRILAEMDGWRADWADVDVRFRRRKSRYGAAVLSMPSSAGSEEKEGQELAEEEEDSVEWELRTTRTASNEVDTAERPRRVTEIVIRRVERGVEADIEIDREVSAEAEVVPAAADEVAASHDDAETGDLASDEPELEPELETTPRAKSQPQYVDQGIQTDDLAALLFPSDADADDDAAASDLPDEDECAVTTSSEDPPSDDEDDDAAQTPRAKSSAFRVLARKAAWEELWQGLSSFAGVGDDELE